MGLEVFEAGNLENLRFTGVVLEGLKAGKEAEVVEPKKETEVVEKEEKVIVRRGIDRNFKTGFELLAKKDDLDIRKMLNKVNITDVITALTNASTATKLAVLRNLPSNLREYVEINILILEKREMREQELETSRTKISEAFVEMLYDVHASSPLNAVI